MLKSWSAGGDSAEVIRFQMGSVGWSSGQLIFRGLLGMNIDVRLSGRVAWLEGSLVVCA